MQKEPLCKQGEEELVRFDGGVQVIARQRHTGAESMATWDSGSVISLLCDLGQVT